MTYKQENSFARVLVYVLVIGGLVASLLILSGCVRERVLRDGTIIREGIDADEVLRAIDGLAERAPEVAMKYLEMKLAFQEARLRELELEQAALEARQANNGGEEQPQVDARLQYILQQVEAVRSIIQEFEKAKEQLGTDDA